MNPVTTDLLLGFENSDIRTLTVTRGDTEHKIHCELHDSLVSYMVEDTTYIFLKGIYSNGTLIVPMRLWTNYEGMMHESELSEDKSEFDFYVPKLATQVAGVAKCTLVFVRSTEVPTFDPNGNVITDDSEILTSENFNMYIASDHTDTGCVDTTDRVQESALLPLVIAAHDIEENEEQRIINENERIKNNERIVALNEGGIYTDDSGSHIVKNEYVWDDGTVTPVDLSDLEGMSFMAAAAMGKRAAHDAEYALNDNVVADFKINENGQLELRKTYYGDILPNTFEFEIVDDKYLEVTING